MYHFLNYVALVLLSHQKELELDVSALTAYLVNNKPIKCEVAHSNTLERETHVRLASLFLYFANLSLL